jgi:hypothetical protein
MRWRGFNHQIAAKRSFCIRGRALPQMHQNGLDRALVSRIVVFYLFAIAKYGHTDITTSLIT